MDYSVKTFMPSVLFFTSSPFLMVGLNAALTYPRVKRIQ
jgi:hypothetical protein